MSKQEEFEDVDLPLDNDSEWGPCECPSCTKLKENLAICTSSLDESQKENTRLRTQEAAAMLTAEFFDGDNKRLVEDNIKLRSSVTALTLDLEVARIHLDQCRVEIFELKKAA